MSADLVTRLRERAAKSPKRIVYPEGTDPRILLAARRVADAKIARPVLIGSPDGIARAAREGDVGLSGIEILECGSAATARYVSLLLPEWRSRGVTEMEA